MCELDTRRDEKDEATEAAAEAVAAIRGRSGAEWVNYYQGVMH